MRFREVDRLLLDDGWYEARQTGSHHIYKHPEKPGIVSVPDHRGDIPNGTLRNIFRQAGWRNNNDEG